MKDILARINKIILEEKGVRVTIDSTLLNADLDSFGITVLFIELDADYKYFKDIPEGIDPFTTINYKDITIKEMVNTCILNTTNT